MTYSIFFHHHGIGEQRISIDLTEENFVREIAPARTFGFLKDIEYLRSNGLAKGGSLENAIILGDSGILNASGLRYKDEFVRHKVLDSVGDFSLIGFPIYGHIIASKSGHSSNVKFLKKLMASTETWDIIVEEKISPVHEMQINI
jgi:UDP-3-O-[3-hydroxymyristoyl] N-acetylglucosamine deacetylase